VAASYPPTGIYEHYKSSTKDKRLYQVIGFARHTETNETLVIYIPLYVTIEHPGLRLQARPLKMFVEEVSVEGQRVPRFRYLGPEL